MTIYTFAAVTTPETTDYDDIRDDNESPVHIVRLAMGDDDPSEQSHAICGIPGELGWAHTDRRVTCTDCLNALALVVSGDM